jgi:hypothetical protein
MRDDAGIKWLTAARLIELLTTMPADSRVMPNAVGNMVVLDATGETMIAYVDFSGDGEVNRDDEV